MTTPKRVTKLTIKEWTLATIFIVGAVLAAIVVIWGWFLLLNWFPRFWW